MTGGVRREFLDLIRSYEADAQAVSPGQGQNVTVAGVEVGQITKVETEDGLAVVTVQLDPDEVGPVYSNATMYLRPKTGLNDMVALRAAEMIRRAPSPAPSSA